MLAAQATTSTILDRAGNKEPEAGITAWLHRGRFAKVMDAVVHDKQEAGKTVPDEWTKALELHDVRATSATFVETNL